MIEKATKKNKKEDGGFSIFFFFLISFFLVFLIFSTFRLKVRQSSLNKNIETLKAELVSLDKKKKELEALIEKTKSEDFWEEKIRQEGYIKKGEKSVVVLGPEKFSTLPSENSKENQENKTLLQKIKNFWQNIIKKTKF